MTQNLSRRDALAYAGACLGAGVLTTVTSPAAEPSRPPAAGPFRYCLNTATLMGFKLPVAQEVEIAGQAGYSGIEPWLRAVQQHVDEGESLGDLKKRIADLGLAVEGAIGFDAWIVDDDAKRAKGIEQMQRDMDLVTHRRPADRRRRRPAHNAPGMDLRKIGERYRAVLELGRSMGVVPQLEIWGGSKTLGRVSEAAFVAIEAGHPDACLLLDVFHIYQGGADFAGLRVLSGRAMHVLHINDYPADPPREKVTDADRVFPGDGVAPLVSILAIFAASASAGVLSLELFNREYWKQDPLTVAKTGLEKIKAVVGKALGA